MDRRLTSKRGACELTTTIRDHFIHVHVELRSTTRHPDVQRKIMFVKATEDLVTGLYDEPVLLVRQATGRMVHICRCLFERGVGRNHLTGNEIMPDTEVLQGTLCLCSPEYVRRNVNLAEAVGFFSIIRQR